MLMLMDVQVLHDAQKWQAATHVFQSILPIISTVVTDEALHRG